MFNSAEKIQQRAVQYKALGDTTRLQLVLFIQQAAPAPVCACSFSEYFEIRQSTLSHHLSLLVDAGILTREQRGRWAYFTLDPDFEISLLGDLRVTFTPLAQENDELTILFACKKNAGRSQIAAALASASAPSGITIMSAGSEPADQVHPEVTAALAALDLKPLSSPKLLDPALVKQADWVITMGCGESCPFFPGIHYEDWEIPDPDGQDPETVAEIINLIRAKVDALLVRVGDTTRSCCE